jgi:phage terminase large subunit GpA-like protein
MHVPAALRKSETEPGPFFEGLVAEVRKSSGRWKKLTENARNEPLDTAVGNHVLAHLNGLDRIAWDRPPPWAAEWDNNSNVLPLRAVSGTEAEDKTGVATAYEPLPEIKPALSAPVVRAPGLAGVKLITRVPFRR